MRIHGRSICFVNCHFAAHMEAVSRRNEDFNHVFRSMTFSSPSNGLLTTSSNPSSPINFLCICLWICIFAKILPKHLLISSSNYYGSESISFYTLVVLLQLLVLLLICFKEQMYAVSHLHLFFSV